MTQKEFSLICMTLVSFYPSMFPSRQSQELWYKMLDDIDAKQMEDAITKYVANNKFPPTVADLRELCIEEISDWSEAWKEVIKAIRTYGSTNINDAMNSFDDITREAVERMGFVNICMCPEDTLSVERANFRQIYTGIAERKKFDFKTPKHLLQQREVKEIEEN